MKVNDKDINVADAMKFANHENLFLKHLKNNIVLNDFQVTVLKNNGFDYQNYTNMSDLLFDIEEYLNEQYIEELDLVSSQISEFLYYRETKK